MKAIGYIESLPIEHERSLFELDLPRPTCGPRDLLVRIEAVSVNPLDAVERKRRAGAPGQPLVLGWDAAGVVEEVGAEVRKFRPGDAVYYSGALNRLGSNAEYGVVDERIAALKPRSLSFLQAAALPLTAITAWESLFDRFKLRPGIGPGGEALLVIGAAGGVGSMAVQLARRLTNLRVIATASRPESRQWVTQLGAHAVIDHTLPLSRELERIGEAQPRYILSLTHTKEHWDEIAAALAPQGQVCFIDIPTGLDFLKLRRKAASIHMEMMMVRVIHPGQDMEAIHQLLTEVAAMVDEGLLQTTLGEHYGPLSVANLKRAHAAVESGSTIGKIVLSGFQRP